MDMLQVSSPTPKASPPLPPAAGTSGGEGTEKTSVFDDVMGKAMGAEGQSDSDGKAPSPDQERQALPVDGTTLPAAPLMPPGVMPPLAPPLRTAADAPAMSLEDMALEGGSLPANPAARLINVLRGASGAINTASAHITPPPTDASMRVPLSQQPVVTRFGNLAIELAGATMTASFSQGGVTDNPNAMPPPSLNNTSPILNGVMANSAPQLNSAPPMTLATPVQQPQWGDDLNNRIVWLVKQDIKTADIRLNPPHLGPLEVKISLQQDQVSVSFSSQHAVVREALDTAMPRLRELLTDNGLQLSQANISNRSPSDQQGGSQHHAGGGPAAGEDEGPLVAEGGAITSGHYLVDYYV